jgi:ParB/RepB/Spo0J family partition protein
MATKTIPLSTIRVGKRHRKDLGDIRSLARSIQEIGLLHPIVIRPDGKLIAGERRLQALKLLGRTKVPVTVLDLAKVIRGEVAENVLRQDFRPSEMVAIARALEPILRREAKARQGCERTCGKISRMLMVAEHGTNSENMLVFPVAPSKR